VPPPPHLSSPLLALLLLLLLLGARAVRLLGCLLVKGFAGMH
jgi:hypothetical protein